MRKGMPRAIIVLPTRELAWQVYQTLKRITHHARLRVRLLVGGDESKKKSSPADEMMDILVTVPGSLGRALGQGTLSGEVTTTMIIDEADQMLDKSFEQDWKKILAKLADLQQLVLCTATTPDDFDERSQVVFPDFDLLPIMVGGVKEARQHLETFNIFVKADEKKQMLKTFLKKQANGKGIIFVNKREEAVILGKELSEMMGNMSIPVIHGDIVAKHREDIIKNFRAEKKDVGATFIIATDILARGLDIIDLRWVLNYDLPFEAVYYVHRSGRAGRDFKPAMIYNFYSPLDQNIVTRINEAITGQTAIQLDLLKVPGYAKEYLKKSNEAKKKKEAQKPLSPQARRRELLNRKGVKVVKRKVIKNRPLKKRKPVGKRPPMRKTSR
jgi:superfamily II DNA/RNA helicase